MDPTQEMNDAIALHLGRLLIENTALKIQQTRLQRALEEAKKPTAEPEPNRDE
jgi:regulator of replication initiation timing